MTIRVRFRHLATDWFGYLLCSAAELGGLTSGTPWELISVEHADLVNYLAVLTHTFWKPVAQNAIFITEDNPTKHRDYDDEVVRTFYITNATSVQEFQEIATAIRTVADIRRVFTYNAQKALIVRASVDAMALAEAVVDYLED